MVASTIATGSIIEFRYKLRMMGIQVRGQYCILCENQGVVLNTSLPSSFLKKKRNAIVYHQVREAVAAGVVKVQHINGKDLITR